MSFNNSKLIAKNTLMLYIRQIFNLLVTLFTVRIVLNALGVEDFGIFNVVAGVVSLWAFLSGTMASATQRFFSYALGQSDFIKLKKVFSINLLIYVVIAIASLVLLETFGLWFVYGKLNVPQARFEAVIYLYQFSAITFIATIFITPFRAIMIAHEDMHLYAVLSIIETCMKLGVALSLKYLPYDKLFAYGMLLLIVSIVDAAFYVIICTRKYAECQFRKFYWDQGVLREVVGFTGWTLFGQVSNVFRHQAITILLNQAFNPMIVAARAVETKITSQVNVFSSNFNVGIYPPIIKSYAADDKKSMFSLIYNGSKITFFLVWVFALPLILEAETILRLWLGILPPGAVLFTRLGLIEVLILSVSLPITTAARAPGKMKTYELTLGSIQIAIFAISWIVLGMGGSAYSIYIVSIIANVVMFIIRLALIRKLIDFNIEEYFKRVFFPVMLIVLLSTLSSYAVYLYLPSALIYRGLSIVLSILFSCISMYFIGLNKHWRAEIQNRIIHVKLSDFKKLLWE
ncbi:MAG TPA: polysaccharide biosynthesis protein [Anaerolineae bacterium]|nr:polysaccharide biosynthesis protein [Anaerolineae bacterium]